MRPLASLLFLFCVLSFAHAADPDAPGKVFSAPDLKGPLGPEWSVGKGRWTPADGVLTVAEIPEEKHVPVLHLATGPRPLVVECEFRMNGGKIFYVGCDGSKHVGRVIVQEKSLRIGEDSTEVKGKSPGHTLAEAKVDLKPGDWQKIRVEYAGERISARLNDVEVHAEHPYLATPKVRWWFAAGPTTELRNVRVSEGAPASQ